MYCLIILTEGFKVFI